MRRNRAARILSMTLAAAALFGESAGAQDFAAQDPLYFDSQVGAAVLEDVTPAYVEESGPAYVEETLIPEAAAGQPEAVPVQEELLLQSPALQPGLPEITGEVLPAYYVQSEDLFTSTEAGTGLAEPDIYILEEPENYGPLDPADQAAVLKSAGALRQSLESGEKAILVSVACSKAYNADFLFDEIRETAFGLGEDEAAGDYLRYNISRCEPGQASAVITPDGYVYQWVSIWEQYTTKQQEIELDRAVRAIVSELAPAYLSEQEKTERIYRYILERSSYDYTESVPAHSAYSALISANAVCQGFSLLFSRLCSAAGVENRILTGGSHMWNLVRVNGLYYNCDVTWEITKGSGTSYLLKSDLDFAGDHTRDERYLREEFLILCPSGGISLR